MGVILREQPGAFTETFSGNGDILAASAIGLLLLLRALIELTFQTCSRAQLIVPLSVELVCM